MPYVVARARSLVFVPVLFVGCGDDTVAGGSTSETTGGDDDTSTSTTPATSSSTASASETTVPGSDATTASGGTTMSGSDSDSESTTTATESSGNPTACGDGIVEGDEECDDGPANADDGACKTDCAAASCGDGDVWNGVEACDDGNLEDSDACPSTCVPASCGDGFVEAGAEECDDANAVETDDCSSTCVSAFCGDGWVLEGTEECDDANAEAGDGCENDCTVTPDPCGPVGVVIYVDDDAVGAGNGTSWADAYTSVFFALQSADQNDELWIAEGSYVSVAENVPVASLVTCVDLYGGFTGSEAAIDERPSPLALTRFTGDFGGDDAASGFADNALHVIAASSVDNVRVDGITVTGGRATDVGQGSDGAGLYAEASNLRLRDVTFIGNVADSEGGGLYSVDGQLTIERALFESNTAAAGGGAYITGADDLTLSDSTFQSNVATDVGAGGGAIMLNSPGSTTNALFQDNTGGAVHRNGEGGHILNDVVFVGNTGSFRGGGMRVSAGATAVVGAIFDGNVAASRGGAISVDSDDVFGISDAELSNNSASIGGAISVLGSANVAIERVVFSTNAATMSGGAIFGSPGPVASTVAIGDSSFVGNFVTSATGDGGAIFSQPLDEVQLFTVDSCRFESNTAPRHGGAISARAPVVVRNSAFWSNEAGGNGGAIYASTDTDSPRILSSSFYANTASGAGGVAIFAGDAGTSGLVQNTVMWGNGSDMTGEDLMTIAYTCSEDFLGVGAGNQLSLSDPFVLGGGNELFLDQMSVCVDNGDDVAATSDYGGIGLDWTGLTTSTDGSADVSPVDMGAHYSP